MRTAARLGQAFTVVLVAIAAVAIIRGYGAQDSPVAKAGAAPAATIGPDGIGKLKLGMTLEQADATGDLRTTTHWKDDGATCTVVELAGGGYAHFARHHGLAVFTAPPTAATPEGIRTGATVPRIAAAYPDYSNPDLGPPAVQVRSFGDLLAPVPGNPAALYVFFFTAGSDYATSPTLNSLLLILAHQDGECTHAAE